MSSAKGSGSPETRARILDKALELVTTRGAKETRISDIARESGVSRQAVYLHFGGRVGLFVAMVNHVDETGDLPRHLNAIFGARTGLEALDAFIRSQAEYNPCIRELADVIDAARLTEDAAQAAWQDRMKSRRDGCGVIVHRLSEEGLLDPSWSESDAADFLWALGSVRLWRDLVVERGWSKERYERHLKRVARAALLWRDSAEPSSSKS